MACAYSACCQNCLHVYSKAVTRAAAVETSARPLVPGRSSTSRRVRERKCRFRAIGIFTAQFKECRKPFALSSCLSDAELPFAAGWALRTRHKCRQRIDFAKQRVGSSSIYLSTFTLEESNLPLGCTDEFHGSGYFTTTVAVFGVGVRPIRSPSVGALVGGDIVVRCRFGKRPTPFPSILVASSELSII